MGDCQHLLPDPRERCPHPAIADGDRCLWHSPSVPKHQPYVAEVFRRADAAGHGCFAGSHLAGVHLADADLRERDLRGADLRDAVLDGCDLRGADLRDANLRRASLRHARLIGARLAGADLSGTSLVGADLREVDFSQAIIAGTVLNAADLRGANLKGARIADFHWNRLTRFAGVRGLEAAEAEGDDSTQIFPAPLALGDQDIDSGERLALAHDPGLERTRLFSLASTATAAPAAKTTAPVLAPPPASMSASLRPTRLGWLVPCLAGASLTAAIWGTLALAGRSDHPSTPTADRHADIARLELQHGADVDELGRLQRRLSDQDAELARLTQQRTAAAGDQERLRALLSDQDAELARLRGADDRATILALRVDELDRLSKDLARQSARQDHIARILADGLEQHRGEAERLARTGVELRTRAEEADRERADAIRLRQELAAMRQERDMLQGLYQRTGNELRQAQRDMQRYLARVNASSLQGMLGDDGGGPLLAVKAGQPLAMGGEFLVSLQIDRATPAGQVQVRLVVQRPAAAANPDATVVLYDQAQRPLRRLSFSFPHVDAGAPFVSATATVSCERFPAHARVLLVPGDATLAAR